MLMIDEHRWPLVVARWGAQVCGCDLEFYRARFECWLGRGEPFALVSVLRAPPKLPPAALDQMAHWLHRRRYLTARRCAGIASVFPAAMPLGRWSCAYRAAASAQLGCPVAAFGDEVGALDWALARLFQIAAAPEATLH